LQSYALGIALNTMKPYVLTSVFVCFFFVGFGQEKHYKNQINRTLMEKVIIKQIVTVPVKIMSSETPKYQRIAPNLAWSDTNNLKTSPPSYKQHQGRPNN